LPPTSNLKLLTAAGPAFRRTNNILDNNSEFKVKLAAMGKIQTSEVIVRIPPSVAADIGNNEIIDLLID